MTPPDENISVDFTASHWCLKMMSGKLTDAEHIAFLAWQDADPANRQSLNDYLRVWQSLDQISVAPDIIDGRGAALRDFRRAQARRHALKPNAWAYVAAIAATIVVAISATTYLASKPQLYKTAVGERRVIALDDGSTISLDGETIVRVKYSAHKRQLWLDGGRANFQVAKSRYRPFTVTVSEKSVLATGTEFTVERLTNEIHVVLLHGKVSVYHQTGSETPHLLHIGGLTSDQALTPGSELISRFGSDIGHIVKVDTDQSLDWESGQLSFDATPLPQAVERVNRYSRQKIEISPDVPSTITISGVFQAGNINTFLDGVTHVSGLSYATLDGKILLKRGPHAD